MEYSESGFNDFLQRPYSPEPNFISDYDFDTMVESLPAAKLSTGQVVAKNLVIDLDTGAITSSDGTNIRVYIADGIFRVSKPGFNADTATGSNLIFSSSG